MAEMNKTELKPYDAMEREVLHRDMIAHVLRWTHVLNRATIGMKILDFGCGSGGLAETFYRNRFKPARFLGLEIRPGIVKKLEREFPWAEFKEADLTKPLDVGTDWDLITSFEVLEHCNRKNGQAFVDNLAKCCNEKTVVMLSTPNYDEAVGCAQNHFYDGQRQEYAHTELQALLETRFIVTNKWGTFISIKDYKDKLDKPTRELWEKLHDYYDSNFLAIIFAPLFPEIARNCLWELKKK